MADGIGGSSRVLVAGRRGVQALFAHFEEAVGLCRLRGPAGSHEARAHACAGHRDYKASQEAAR